MELNRYFSKAVQMGRISFRLRLRGDRVRVYLRAGAVPGHANTVRDLPEYLHCLVTWITYLLDHIRINARSILPRPPRRNLGDNRPDHGCRGWVTRRIITAFPSLVLHSGPGRIGIGLRLDNWFSPITMLRTRVAGDQVQRFLHNALCFGMSVDLNYYYCRAFISMLLNVFSH